MSTSNLPGFTAEASLYKTRVSYRSQATRRHAGRQPVAAQALAAPGPGLVVPAWKVVTRCTKNEDGYWECDTEEVVI
jgi:hypothetical protein